MTHATYKHAIGSSSSEPGAPRVAKAGRHLAGRGPAFLAVRDQELARAVGVSNYSIAQ